MTHHSKAPSAGSIKGNGKAAVAFLGTLVLAISVCLGAAGAIADSPPVVTIDGSPTAEYTTAEVSGTVNPNGGPSTTYWHFEYTTTPADEFSWQYGPGGEISGPDAEGTSPVPVSSTIQGLQPSTEYSVRLVAENGEFSNRVVTEAPYPTFTTKGPVAKPTASLDPVTTFDATTAHFSGKVNPGATGTTDPGFDVDWHFECSPACPNGQLSGHISADNSNHTVEGDATGLEPNTDYSVELFATNAGGTESAGPQTFHTPAVEPSAETVPAFAIKGGTEALVGARINPHNSATTYWIEYGTSTAYGTSAPVSEDASAGSGGASQLFTQQISGLTPSTVYHFRTVAENASGKVEGEDRTFETAPAEPVSEPSCPNATLRTENNSNALPECRAYEQVSPVDKNGFDAGINIEIRQQGYVASTDGSAVFFQSFGGFGDAKTAAVLNQYLSRRSSAGWETHGLTPAQKIKTLNGGIPQVSWLTPDLSFAAIQGGQQGHLAPGDNPETSNTYRLDTLTGTYATLAPNGGAMVGGGTDDGSRIFLESFSPLTPEAEGTVTSRGAYEWHEGQLKLVSIMPNGEPAPDGFFQTAAGTLRNEVSADGSRVVFKANEPLQLYLREDGVRTLDITASRGGESGPSQTVYVGASADGSRIFFQNTGNLTPDASGDLEKLYLFEPETETLTNLTAGALPGSPQAVTSHGTAGSGVAGISEDGEYVYFYSTSRFHPGDNLGGGSGLYVWHNGTVRFIGPDDGSMDTDHSPARVSPNGQLLSFTSSARMTAYDNTNTTEVYVYDAANDRLTCVSCNPSGQPNGGAEGELPANPTFQVLNFQPGVRDDGTLFFSSRDALVPQDVNGKMDVYLWKEGRVRLISSGSGGSDSFLASSSANGDNVFFLTRDRLVATDRDDSADIYDARVGGGFPQAVEPSLCEGIEGCQGPASNPPPFDDPASGSFSSPLKRLDPNAQRLRKALKACKHKKKKKARARCRAAAKKRYSKASNGRAH